MKPAAEDAAQELATATDAAATRKRPGGLPIPALDGHGRLIAGSTNSIYKELRTAAR